jgi:hypothetical protein
MAETPFGAPILNEVDDRAIVALVPARCAAADMGSHRSCYI